VTASQVGKHDLGRGERPRPGRLEQQSAQAENDLGLR
jgi:hypothetical protein